MIVSSILGAAALMALAPDPTQAARHAYTSCLRAFMEKSVKEKMTVEAFTDAFAQQCVTQENAYRSAVRTFQSGMRIPAAEVDEIIKEEVDAARDNIKQRFEMHMTPA
jgi:gas vesicle protein